MKKLLFAAAGLLACVSVSAQYYSWGSDAASLRWRTIKTPDFKIVYPDTLEHVARRTQYYIEQARPYVSYGYRHPGLPGVPFVMHPENFIANGLTMWMPKRIDMLAIPDVENFSVPWYKHLAAHEYRHTVQYNNLNRGVIRVLSWFLGQQGSTVGLLFMPLWALEGDAVTTETQMTTYGRGLQPSFSMTYRAVGRDILSPRNRDKWFCGSYRDYVPDHYHLGYQLVSYSYDRYGDMLWSDILRYAVRNPYVFFTTHVGLKKYAQTSVRQLFVDTFTDLNDFWDMMPETTDSGRQISAPVGSYTSYNHPEYISDNRVLALKEDLAHAGRFVEVDVNDGREWLMKHTGLVSTRPVTDGRRVWWTEYRRSTLFDERVNSQLCYMDLDSGSKHAVRKRRNALYPAIAGDSLAWIEYRPDGRYLLAVSAADKPGKADRMSLLPVDTEIHGLAWDDMTQRYYVLVTDDSGMWIGRVVAGGELEPLTRAAYITLSNLRAADGRLYFGSIASGKDEVHMLDLRDTVQRRITSSRYGAFAPSPSADGRRVVMTQYDRNGYHLSEQQVDAKDYGTVEWSQVPVDVVNPARRRWDVINLDTVKYEPADSVELCGKYPSKRRSRIGLLFNIHSWMPVSIDVFEAIEEHTGSLNLGATLLSQNLLSNADGYVSYGWNRREGSMVFGGMRYDGLGVRLSVKGYYGGDQMVYSVRVPDGEGNYEHQAIPAKEKYWSLSAGASLPMVFDGGYHTRQLSLSTAWNYSNGLIANIDRLEFDKETGVATNLQEIGYSRGLHKMSFGISFSDQVRRAQRDFMPRWGYMLAADYTLNPTNRLFSDLVSLYGRVYTPGVARHHSLDVAAAYQTSVGKMSDGRRKLFGYKSARLIPAGYMSSDIVSDGYFAVSAMYRLPLCYPDGGIPGVVYFKRIRLGAGFDFARFNSGGKVKRLYSYGLEAAFDVNFLRMPAAGTTPVTVTVFRTDRGKFSVQAGLGLPF